MNRRMEKWKDRMIDRLVAAGKHNKHMVYPLLAAIAVVLGIYYSARFLANLTGNRRWSRRAVAYVLCICMVLGSAAVSAQTAYATLVGEGMSDTEAAEAEKPDAEMPGTETSDTEKPDIGVPEGEYTVSFEAGRGEVSPPVMTTTEQRLAELPVPQRGGYTFGGWYTDPVDGTKISEETVFSEDTTIYARWTPYVMILKGVYGVEDEVRLYWKRCKGADHYTVYWSYCDGADTYQSLAITDKNRYTHEGLDPKKSYKYFVMAYQTVDGREVPIAKSPTIHVTGRKTKSTNTRAVELKKTEAYLETEKTYQIKAETVYWDKKKKLLNHGREFRYYSSNKAVAIVDQTGKITAVGSGSCYIYVVASDGMYMKMNVTVS